MKITRFTSQFLLLPVFVWAVGCAYHNPTPDPMAGFHFSSLNNLDSNKVITDDYKDYIQQQKLSPEKGKYVAYIEYFEDGTGQHAVKVTISLNHTVWEHFLIYDKDGKRIRTIKYSSGHVSC